MIHIAWVRGSCCLRGKPRRKGDRLIEFFMDIVVIFLSFRLVQAESLMACFVVVTDVQPEIRPEVTGKTEE
jgi:hypothetical protein